MSDYRKRISGKFKILLVGYGEMGQAMLDGWLKHDLKKERIIVVEPNEEKQKILEKKEISFIKDIKEIPKDFVPEIIFFAVRPQNMEQTVEKYKTFVKQGSGFVSIAAGKTLSFFEKILGKQAQIIRAMPNSPATVMSGITVAIAGKEVSEDTRLQSSTLLEAVGEMIWIRNEDLLDTVTAVSGSGPAYVFHLVEAMAKAGQANGLPEYLSMRLAKATVCGAGKILYNSVEDASDLRQKVATKGGTTAAAFEALLDEKNGLTSLMTKAVEKATKRSKELGNS